MEASDRATSFSRIAVTPRRFLSVFFPRWRTEFPIENSTEKLNEIVRWAYRFSPLVAIDRPAIPSEGEERCYYGINLDISGCDGLFGGVKNLVLAVRRGLKEKGISPLVGVAPTLGAAWALSRYSNKETFVVEQAELCGVLGELPIAALRIDIATKEALAELNIRRIGELYLLSRSSLLARFGSIFLAQLDRALGAKAEPIEPYRPLPLLCCEQLFDGPTSDWRSLETALKQLLNNLLKRLANGNRKPAVIVFEAYRVGAPRYSITIQLSVPSQDQNHLWSLLRTKLERLPIGFGIERFVLLAPKTEQVEASYVFEMGRSNSTEGGSKKELGELIDTLRDRLGGKHILTLHSNESHFPEKAFGFSPLQRLAKENSPPVPLLEAERPSILFYRPRPLAALSLLPDGAPFQLLWQEKRYRLVAATGPERIAPEWWGKDEELYRTRDYFKVQLPTGLWLWIYRELETGKWFLHGIWA